MKLFWVKMNGEFKLDVAIIRAENLEHAKDLAGIKDGKPPDPYTDFDILELTSEGDYGLVEGAGYWE